MPSSWTDGRDPLRLPGALLFIAVAQFIPALAIAEALHPNYNVSSQPISDLGATCRTVSGVTSCSVVEPSAIIFDASVFLLGLLDLAAGYLIFERGEKVLSVVVAFAAVGAMGVGLFPETTGNVHLIASLVTFLFAGLSAILSFRLVERPVSYLFAALGAASLLALLLYASSTYLGLGQGGMERMIAYPELLWSAGFGAYLMGA